MSFGGSGSAMLKGPKGNTVLQNNYDIMIVDSLLADGEGSLNLRIKTLEEKIPSSYDQLRQRIERLAKESRTHLTPPIIRKELFW